MTPDKTPFQLGDMSWWGYLGLFLPAFVSKKTGGSEVSWKWVVGIAGGIITVLLGIVGVLLLLGVSNIQTSVKTVEERQVAIKDLVKDMKADMKTANAQIEAKNSAQDQCLERIEREINHLKEGGKK